MIRIFVLVLSLTGTAALADVMKLAVTTSFHNSGLSDTLLPAILEETGIEVQLLVVGTGQALRLGRAGDVDAILVHSRAAEEAFVAGGFATHRREIMYNDFVLIGPRNDPARVSEETTTIAAFQQIAKAKEPFISRGDDSGTHQKEASLWHEAGLNPEAFDRWYTSVGAGMGASLNTASAMDAYILADRASWLNFGNKAGLALLFSGDPNLFNQYAYLPVNPKRHGHVNAKAADKLETWLTGPSAQALIDGLQIDGQTLFVFNAGSH